MKIRYVGYITHVGEIRNECRILAGNLTDDNTWDIRAKM
jgi:hypothetical protein